MPMVSDVKIISVQLKKLNELSMMLFLSHRLRQVTLLRFSGFIYRNTISKEKKKNRSFNLIELYNSLKAMGEGISCHNSKSRKQAGQ